MSYPVGTNPALERGMISLCRLFLFLFFLQQLLPAPLLADPGKQPRLAVFPFHDGEEDLASDKTAEIFRLKLGETPLDLIEEEKMPGSHARSLLSKAREHYYRFAYGAALAELAKAIKIFEENPGLIALEGKAFADCHATLALVHTALGKKGEALKDFEKLLRRVPAYSPDPQNFPPSVRKIFLQARAGLQGGLKEDQPLKPEPELSGEERQLEEGLRAAQGMNADKVLLVDVDADRLTARMIDPSLRAGHPPLTLKLEKDAEGLEAGIERLTRLLFAQTQIDLPRAKAANPKAGKKSSRKFLWGGLGLLGVTGLVAGILAASGGSSEPPAGSISLEFK